MAKPFHYDDFPKNDARLVFRLDTQVMTQSVDIYILMDLPEGTLLVHGISAEEGLSLSQAKTFLENGKAKKGRYPKRLLLAREIWQNRPCAMRPPDEGSHLIFF